jgi:GNAT superfamily N-acetyltransferase
VLSLRDATPADAPLIRQFIVWLAEYEREPDAVRATVEDILRDGFGPNPYFRVVIAEWDGEPAGFAFYFFSYSTWLGRPSLYLEDLFVRPPHRGKGIGAALLRHLAKIAVDRKCGRFVWQVLDWNEPSIRFYESLGAKVVKEWLTMRVEGEAIAELAGGDGPPGENR